jgi:hypothetical protein
MKLSIFVFAAVLAASAASAGQIGSGDVKSVKDNGIIAGNPSWTITCASGWGVVIRKNGKWTDSSGYSYSDRTWSLSLRDFARKMCG